MLRSDFAIPAGGSVWGSQHSHSSCFCNEGLYLYAVSSVCPMSLDDLALSGMFPFEVMPIRICLSRFRQTSSLEKTPSECRMPGQMLIPLSQHLFLRWNAARHGVKPCSLMWARHRGSPGAGKPHAGKYRELTPPRQRGGGGSGLPLTHCVS